jgi:hypothetical protein
MRIPKGCALDHRSHWTPRHDPLASRVNKGQDDRRDLPDLPGDPDAGQPIGKFAGRWHHAACLVRRQPMIGPHSGA